MPVDYEKTLNDYTHRGFRVLAVGYKRMNVQAGEISKLKREEAEKDIEFLGFIIMENRIKEKTI